MKLNLKSIINTLKDVRNYVFPTNRITNKFKGINSLDALENFIQERSAHVTQTTLYGYIKTRIGSRYALMFEDEVFSKSINIAKWNIYVKSLADCTFYTFSYLIDKKNLKKNESEKIFISILEKEKNNGLSIKILEEALNDFRSRLKLINWNNHHKEKPFSQSGLALYNWSPIAENLKKLDKEIVLNSINLKWNLVENEFIELTKNLKFN
ncbi:esterase [Pelagibacteraceae bacterium]|nr:esterase [Pelagibacteraceae bacterium]